MSFPGLQRCEHGEYLDRECLRCEVKRLKDEIATINEDRICLRRILEEDGKQSDRKEMELKAEIERLKSFQNSA